MARLNISIPDELKERMDRTADLNWSEIARRAFEIQLNILDLKGKNMEQKAGIERLRASKVQNHERQHAEGFADGKQWATEQADYGELERVAALGDVDYDVTAIALCTAIIGVDDPYAMISVHEAIFGEIENPSEHRIMGFIEGASEVFAQV